MAVKTFTDSTTLPASDINTYLNNGGLVYITSQTIGSAVSSVTVSNCFSSTYDNYKIIVNGGAGSSSNAAVKFEFVGITSGYYIGIVYLAYSAGSTPPSGFAAANAANWQEVGNVNTNGIHVNMDILNANLAKYKTYSCGCPNGATAGSFVISNGLCASTTQATGFTLTPASGTMTGGTITVYGYRKA